MGRSGAAYQVHELLPGAAPTEVNEATLETILALVELQAGRWIVFGGGEGWSDLLRGYSEETAELMRALDAAVAPHRDAHGQQRRRARRLLGRARPDGRRTRDGCGRLRPGGLHARIVEIAGPGGAAVCLAYQVIDSVAWTVQHGETRWLPGALRVGRALVERIARLA